MVDELSLSYSGVSTWRECQQKYAYRYIEHILPKVEAPAPTLGSAVHTYLDVFYRNMTAGMNAHRWALNALEAEWSTPCREYSRAAMAVDQRELAAEFSSLVGRALDLCNRYYAARGRSDADQFEVLACEREFDYPLTDGARTKGRIDLITVDRNGLTCLWEHKTTKSVPRHGRRLRDLQTVLYKAIAEEELGLHIDAIIWNYIRTKAPTIPRLLKSGALSRDASLETTWPVYQREIQIHGLNEDDYADVRTRLINAEYETFFVRAQMPLLGDERVLLRDMVTTARQIIRFHEKLARNPKMPIVRTVSFSCDFCSFAELCVAAITGGDQAAIRRKFYMDRTPTPTREGNDDDEQLNRILERELNREPSA